MARLAPPRLRLSLGGLILLVASCAGGPGAAPGGSGGGTPAPRIPRYETFLRNPTEIRAEEVQVLLPALLFDEIHVEGLSGGFEMKGEDRVWSGTGDCVLRVLSLVVHASRLKVSVAPPGARPEFLLTAQGDVRFAHSVRGVGSLAEGLHFLFLRDDRSLER